MMLRHEAAHTPHQTDAAYLGMRPFACILKQLILASIYRPLPAWRISTSHQSSVACYQLMTVSRVVLDAEAEQQ